MELLPLNNRAIFPTFFAALVMELISDVAFSNPSVPKKCENYFNPPNSHNKSYSQGWTCNQSYQHLNASFIPVEVFDNGNPASTGYD